MNNEGNKRNLGLVALFALSLITACSIRQVSRYGMPAVIVFVISVVAVIFLWKYLLRKKIITLTWASTVFEPHGHKSERFFLYSLTLLAAPVLKFHNITVSNIVLSIIAVVLCFSLYAADEHLLAKKKAKN